MKLAPKGLSRISAWGLIEPFAACPFTIFGISPALPMAALGLLLIVDPCSERPMGMKAAAMTM